MKRLYSAEYVSKGHPDKLADLISDTLLDEHIKIDPDCHVACETLISNDLIIIAGEIKSSVKHLPIEELVKRVLNECGYDKYESGFNMENSKIIVNLNQQSIDIDNGIRYSHEYRSGNAKEEADYMGAGDQGIVIGYACNETDVFMPLAYMIARDLIEKVEDAREKKVLPYLRPVSKSLVSVIYDNHKPIDIEEIVISAQHIDSVTHKQIESDLIELVIKQCSYSHLITPKTKIFINPAGKFCIGGPRADTGLTGRKIIVDTYGGRARHGGGAFSGKDPSKVDRSGAYLCRWIAKHLVYYGYAEECEIELLYAIGVSRPINIAINCFGTETIPVEELIKKTQTNFDLRPYSIIKELELRAPIYANTVKSGHFGHSDKFSWERIIKKV